MGGRVVIVVPRRRLVCLCVHVAPGSITSSKGLLLPAGDCPTETDIAQCLNRSSFGSFSKVSSLRYGERKPWSRSKIITIPSYSMGIVGGRGTAYGL